MHSSTEEMVKEDHIMLPYYRTTCQDILRLEEGGGGHNINLQRLLLATLKSSWIPFHICKRTPFELPQNPEKDTLQKKHTKTKDMCAEQEEILMNALNINLRLEELRLKFGLQ
jgi:hypothetical protein